MKEYKQNLLIVCMNDLIGQETSKLLADELGMLYASSKDIVDYEVFDSKAVIEKCGMEYFEKKQVSTLKHISRYENCVIFVDYDYFTKGLKYFTNSCNLIYLRLKKKQLSSATDQINLLAYEERDNELLNKTEMLCEYCHGAKKTVQNLLKMLRGGK